MISCRCNIVILGLKQVGKIVCIGVKTNKKMVYAGFEAGRMWELKKLQSKDCLSRECSVSISVEIICFEHLQQWSYENSTLSYFCKSIYSRLQIATMMALWKMITVFQSSSWNFSTHIVKYFIHQSLQIFTEKVTL